MPATTIIPRLLIIRLAESRVVEAIPSCSPPFFSSIRGAGVRNRGGEPVLSVMVGGGHGEMREDARQGGLLVS